MDEPTTTPPRAEPAADVGAPTQADGLAVSALLFAGLREAAGRASLDLRMPPGSTVREVARAVERAAGVSLAGALCAVNEAYAEPDRAVAEGDRVAFLPPVSGG